MGMKVWSALTHLMVVAAAMVTLVAHYLFPDPAMNKSVLSPLDLPLDVKVGLQLVSLKFPCTDLGSQVLLESNWNRPFYNCFYCYQFSQINEIVLAELWVLTINTYH